MSTGHSKNAGSLHTFDTMLLHSSNLLKGEPKGVDYKYTFRDIDPISFTELQSDYEENK